ncbi:hypothetical protein Pla175_01010 [Pirellulimonas nuda]|uniref:DnaJ domain protein n=1 Tax=Pirellulimonas nuda TaxID=2528009 RepID=A0A518D5K3_9BACT|nr:hypothetical protein [Pirellulimonas nuda]QDU86751.1 hypothetical protein Pla175_01010 [Pirellulimonas nuda]
MPTHAWPDSLDIAMLAFWALVLVGAPIAGYVLMVVDYRAYLRSLRRALVVVRSYATGLPSWVREHEPPCLKALGLTLPVTREQVLAAYRQKVKTIHPDLGGSRRDFTRLQEHFEQALLLADDAT